MNAKSPRLPDDYVALRERTCLSYWYPRLLDAGIPMPQTTIVKTEAPLWQLMDGDEPAGYDEFLMRLGDAADAIGYPCFLRTGHGSGKHDWNQTCHLVSRDVLRQHIYRLVEWSEMVDIIGLPYNVWVVREMLPTQPVFTAFHGRMPICREFRYFIRDGDVVSHHPYWPAEALADAAPSDPDWRRVLGVMNGRTATEHARLVALSHRVATVLPGYWSVDWLWTQQGWYLTDMAAGELSWKPEEHNGD